MDREDNNWWQNGGQKSTPSTEREEGEKRRLVGGPISTHDPFPSPSLLRFRPTTESLVISRCSIDKLFRACCTRAAGAFQRGAAAGAPPRPHQHLSSVYFPMISPSTNPPPTLVPRSSLFSFRFVFPPATSPSPRGLLHTVYRQQGGEIETQQLPFRKRMFRAAIVIRSSTFFVMLFVFRSGLPLGRETRCGNKGWFFCFLVPVVTS